MVFQCVWQSKKVVGGSEALSDLRHTTSFKSENKKVVGGCDAFVE